MAKFMDIHDGMKGIPKRSFAAEHLALFGSAQV